MRAAVYDGGRDSFLERSSARPPSKFDSIEYLDADSGAAGKGKSNSSRRSRITSAAGGLNNAGTSTCSSDISCPSSNATATGVWSWGDGNSSRANTEATQAASSWKEEVSGRRNKPSIAPSSCNYRKKFYWGPRVTRQGQEANRDVRSTNMGEPVTFALCVPILLRHQSLSPAPSLFRGPGVEHSAHVAHTLTARQHSVRNTQLSSAAMGLSSVMYNIEACF